jgi:hypothetical protein
MAGAERLWRVRKNHTWIDAQLHDSGNATFELRMLYDGDVILRRECATRTAAVSCAAERLRELQRAGWNTHW